jgi:transcriptional regulator with XRE-family HTH domain
MPVINMEQTGKQIAELRKNANLTVNDIKEALALTTVNAVYKWQRGQTLPTLDNLVALAALFDCTINDIVITETI